MKIAKEIVLPLLRWYQTNHRKLPWREDATAYHVWVSEIMLQQTRVETVIDYYNRFMSVLPTISDLANIDEEKLLKLWEGLGYYSRVRNLQKTARILCEEGDGTLPKSYEELLALPGIGAYTSGAICSIAYGEKVAAVDGNVLRVMSRVSASKECIDLEKTKKAWKERLEEVMPEESGIFNQALMEIGATICIPNGMPNCDRCPLADYCKAHKQNNELSYPVRKEKIKRKIESMTVLLFLYENQVMIQKREATGLLANFYEFPHLSSYVSKEEVRRYCEKESIPYIGIEPSIDAKHIFTHKEWHMKSYIVWLGEKISDKIFATLQELDEVYPIPGAFDAYHKMLKKYAEEKSFLNF